MSVPDRANDPRRKPNLDMPGWVEQTPDEWARGAQAKMDAKASKSPKVKKHEHEWDEDPQPNNWGDYGPLNCEVPGCKARLHNWEPGTIEPGQKSNIIVEGK